MAPSTHLGHRIVAKRRLEQGLQATRLHFVLGLVRLGDGEAAAGDEVMHQGDHAGWEVYRCDLVFELQRL